MSLRELRRHVGRLLIAGFDGRVVPAELKALAREFDLGGVILFGRNVDGPEQTADLTFELQRLERELPLWISVDQEGGRVARLRAPFTEWPPMSTLGRSGDSGLAERFARALAAELRAVGVTLDYAPVLDVHTNPKNPVIGDRALSDRPDLVARLGAVIVRTLQAEGVAACGKHFPGHGDTGTDSHKELPLVEHPPDRLRAVEFVPFRAAIDAGVAAIMTAHVLVPALDEERPATLSPVIVRGLLKEELGYGGMVLSDDLEMQAIAGRMDVADAAVAALAAGCDGLLICGTDHDRQAHALEAIIHAVEREGLPFARIEDAWRRIEAMKLRFLAAGAGGAPSLVPRGGRPPSALDLRRLVGTAAHQAVADEMARFL
ncbi:MAG TPA: beta-N-acetylhexosaminidase [Vicinamibacterales bacterium]|nr:beta-N-acetylhexosaminidase [Vicinamibacterales bacterium]